jgi:iron complex transport system ATP-binding protein
MSPTAHHADPAPAASSTERDPILDVRDVAFGYRSRTVGRDVTFAVHRGESLAVLGGNGAGKTTLFRTLLGFLAPRQGTISVAGRSLGDLRPDQRARRVAYVPQHHVPSVGFSVLETVLMGRASHLRTFTRPGERDRAIARDALASLRIEGLAQRRINEISGGERQLVMIARALAQQAPIIVLDEPTASLDFGNRARVLAEIDRLRASGMTILFSTHEPDHALAHADRALLLADGRPLALDAVARALTPRNIEQLYGTPVRLVHVADGRVTCLPQ